MEPKYDGADWGEGGRSVGFYATIKRGCPVDIVFLFGVQNHLAMTIEVRKVKSWKPCCFESGALSIEWTDVTGGGCD